MNSWALIGLNFFSMGYPYNIDDVGVVKIKHETNPHPFDEITGPIHANYHAFLGIVGMFYYVPSALLSLIFKRRVLSPKQIMELKKRRLI